MLAEQELRVALLGALAAANAGAPGYAALSSARVLVLRLAPEGAAGEGQEGEGREEEEDYDAPLPKTMKGNVQRSKAEARFRGVFGKLERGAYGSLSAPEARQAGFLGGPAAAMRGDDGADSLSLTRRSSTRAARERDVVTGHVYFWSLLWVMTVHAFTDLPDMRARADEVLELLVDRAPNATPPAPAFRGAEWDALVHSGRVYITGQHVHNCGGGVDVDPARRAQSFRVPLFAACTLNATGPCRVTPSRR